ncbi:type II CRISPR-associated endonuclease Cas1 [Alkalihalobacillus pseudalcaliphilus]|uniref:type II CRISPR-associated endonuclease Cas1 n=1 Tax=Alkalihalobacillus pseudalcaliphilus TaxID=79884 RepID=UPI00064D90A1|nr:type II CRISPR-associated endonuclease Cas1 [Alkalihalobacillus pseudalcaliphilus]KMK77705.1 hypothetical protein AB990_04415 [Alkalihalobacillus pseudalcaliphilus]
MTWRHIFITKPSKLSVKNSQFVIKQENEVSIPFQDIASITLENEVVTLTQSVLAACAQHRISLIGCDQKKMPVGIFTAFHQHSRQLTVLTMQQSLSKPLKKRIWQTIVKQKISNQADCLIELGKDGARKLQSLANQVESGDKSNREAYAARVYFLELFGDEFTRRSSDERNKILNYGYSIMRSAVARSLVAYGFTPSLGIYHDSQTNAFNLADDFMEVLRPVVDRYVVSLTELSWTVQTRANLVNLLNTTVALNGAKYDCSAAVDEMIKSFVAVCRQQDVTYLKLPTLSDMSESADLVI